ncbi:hypothetical protein H4R27_004613 [Coemansia aciculifera]|nr:hypothetical protein H4R27_004613 [Coemansia aciculifera]
MTKKKRTVAVLSEAEFTSGIDAIIQRDYFPRTLDGAQQRQCSQTARQSGSLDEYLRAHTSEDNASFRRMVDSDKQRRDERYSRVDPGDSGRSGFRLAAPSPRELAALRLGKRPTQAAVVRGSNTRSPLSPAAHRLLLLQSGRRTPARPGNSSDLDLRRAYNSPR